MILNGDSMGLTLMGERPILNTGPTRTYWLLATVNLYRPSAPSLVGTNASLDSEATLESRVNIADMAATKEAKCRSDSVVSDLLQFLNASPTAFHAVGNSHFISFLASSLTRKIFSVIVLASWDNPSWLFEISLFSSYSPPKRSVFHFCYLRTRSYWFELAVY